MITELPFHALTSRQKDMARARFLGAGMADGHAYALTGDGNVLSRRRDPAFALHDATESPFELFQKATCQIAAGDRAAAARSLARAIRQIDTTGEDAPMRGDLAALHRRITG